MLRRYSGKIIGRDLASWRRIGRPEKNQPTEQKYPNLDDFPNYNALREDQRPNPRKDELAKWRILKVPDTPFFEPAPYGIPVSQIVSAPPSPPLSVAPPNPLVVAPATPKAVLSSAHPIPSPPIEYAPTPGQDDPIVDMSKIDT